MIRKKQQKSKFLFLHQTEHYEDVLDKMADYVLMAGSIVAAILIMIGTVLFVVNSNEKIPHLIGENFHEALKSAIELQGIGITNLGVFILMITPFLRVITCLIGFSLLRWWRFTLVSLFVLTMLIISMYFSTQI